MTTYILSTPNATEPSTVAGDAIILTSTGVVDGGGSAALSPADGVRLILDGTLYGSRGFTATNGSSVSIGRTGHITAYNLHAGGVKGGGTVTNHGIIDGLYTASGLEIYDSGTVTAYSTSIVNDGTISANAQSAGSAISVNSSGASQVSLVNSGDIISAGGGGPASAYYSRDTANVTDLVRNTGRMYGSINLGGAADFFDGRDGYVYGAVRGGTGNDTLTGGLSADSLYGDDGDDVINFSIEDAVVKGGNGYDIARNTYNDFGLTFDMGGNGIEAYYGSMAGETIRTSANVRMDVDAGGGNDLVLGSEMGDGISGGAGDDQIFGNGGPDNLAGGFGNDTIEGGAGADILTGEAGNDRFVFRGVDGANVDTITDFIIGEDKIQILRSGFLSPAQWGPGALDPARFVASANPSPINGTACFLFDNAGPGVGTLYWNDGSGSAQGLAVITTNNPLFFTAADFVLV